MHVQHFTFEFFTKSAHCSALGRFGLVVKMSVYLYMFGYIYMSPFHAISQRSKGGGVLGEVRHGAKVY